MDRMSLQILRALWRKPLDIWELVIMQDNDIKSVYDTLEKLKNDGLIKYSEDKNLRSQKRV
jgi:hypothetical protein